MELEMRDLVDRETVRFAAQQRRAELEALADRAAAVRAPITHMISNPCDHHNRRALRAWEAYRQSAPLPPLSRPRLRPNPKNKSLLSPERNRFLCGFIYESHYQNPRPAVHCDRR
jgi:hypothetical protein